MAIHLINNSIPISKSTISFNYQPDYHKRLPISLNSPKTTMITSQNSSSRNEKTVWIWTENKQVMTTAVERGWNTFIFTFQNKNLATEWASMALISPIFIEDGGLFDGENKRIASFKELSSAEELNQFKPEDEDADNLVIDLLDWQHSKTLRRQCLPSQNLHLKHKHSLRPWSKDWVELF